MKQQSEKYLYTPPQAPVLSRDFKPFAEDIASLIEVTDVLSAEVTQTSLLGNSQIIQRDITLERDRSVVYVDRLLLMANFTNNGIVRII